MASQVSTRGQITIDRAIRDRLGVQPGMVAVQSVVGDRLEVVFLPAPHRRSLFGALQGVSRGKAPRTPAAVEAAVRDAILP
jgi:bifunctional DNA-binding transcriptional regulator/antitoxin component of YhaV-PrlF toxin-antitoxin module